VGFEEFMGSLRYSVGVFQLTLPNRQNAPSCFLQISNVAPITRDVGSKLRLPKHRSALRCRGITACVVPVPEASMDKDDFLEGSENQVRPAREFFGVQTVPVPHSVHNPAKGQFRTGVLRADRRHDGGPFLDRNVVDHTLRSSKQRPLIINVFFCRIAQNPCGGNLLLTRESFNASINFGWKTHGRPYGTRFLACLTPDWLGSVYHNSVLAYVQHITAQRSRMLEGGICSMLGQAGRSLSPHLLNVKRTASNQNASSRYRSKARQTVPDETRVRLVSLS
jgi:hypothetical protein